MAAREGWSSAASWRTTEIRFSARAAVPRSPSSRPSRDASTGRAPVRKTGVDVITRGEPGRSRALLRREAWPVGAQLARDAFCDVLVSALERRAEDRSVGLAPLFVGMTLAPIVVRLVAEDGAALGADYADAGGQGEGDALEGASLGGDLDQCDFHDGADALRGERPIVG